MQIKFILILILLLLNIYAKTDLNSTKITADSFEYNDLKHYTYFKGNVKIYTKKDILFADSVYVFFNKDKTPIKYILKGNVNFNIFIQTKKYIGKGDKIILEPLKDKITIINNAYLEDKTTGQKIKGDKIFFDKKNGFSSVFGKKNRPVTFIIN